MSVVDDQTGAARAHVFRVCDRRFPFLWTVPDQPPARWHGAGEGPCHYLATTAEGAWAEVVRHEHITDLDDLLDLELSLWSVEAPAPAAAPALPLEVLTGAETSYPACRAEAQRLRAGGAIGLRAPSAAVVSGQAERFGVDASGVYVVATVATETVVLFGPPNDLVGMPLAEGHPDPSVLGDIRYL
jgi:hypothetical protein